MFTCIVLLLFLSLFIPTRARLDEPPSGYIFLALGVSKAAYLSLPRPGQTLKYQVIKDSYCRKACDTDGWDVRGTGEIHDTEVILFEHPILKFAVFGFRGTEPSNLYDWKENFRSNLVSVRIGGRYMYKLHQGFQDRFHNIRQWFDDQYIRLSSEKFRIILTGHSLGGALATIAAAHASGLLNYRPFAVITFASPKVGNRAFSRYYNRHVRCDRSTIRFVVQYDIIPNFPPAIAGYEHVCPASTIMDQNGRFDILKHHSIDDGYDKALRKKYQGRRMRDVSYVCYKSKPFE